MTFFFHLLKHHFPKKDFCGSSNLIQSTRQYSHKQLVLRTIRKKRSLSHEKKWMKTGYLICCHGSLVTLSLAERVGTTSSVGFKEAQMDRHLIAPMTGEVADFDVCKKGICRGRKGMTFVQYFKPLF